MWMDDRYDRLESDEEGRKRSVKLGRGRIGINGFTLYGFGNYNVFFYTHWY